MTRLSPPLMIVLAYITLVAGVMVIRPAVFINYFVDPKIFFDVKHYVDIAMSGYPDEAVAAFYPLWPMLIKILTVFTSSKSLIIFGSGLLAFLLFLATLLPMQKLLVSYLKPSAAWAWTALYAFNPNSFFHAVGYSESLCSLLLIVYLIVTHRYFEGGKRKFLYIVFGGAVLLSLSRPILPIIITCVVAAGMLRVCLYGRSELKAVTSHIFASIFGALLGYSLFGFYNLQRFGSFWQPFHAQKFWDREFGFHWNLFHKPSTVGGSDNILVWDLQAFYIPTIVVVVGCILLWMRKVRPHEMIESVCKSYLFWFCSFFAFCHSAIAFLTYDKFMSLGRHVWGTPAVFVSLAILMQLVPKGKVSVFGFRFYLFASCVYLAIFWARFGRMAWIG